MSWKQGLITQAVNAKASGGGAYLNDRPGRYVVGVERLFFKEAPNNGPGSFVAELRVLASAQLPGEEAPWGAGAAVSEVISYKLPNAGSLVKGFALHCIGTDESQLATLPNGAAMVNQWLDWATDPPNPMRGLRLEGETYKKKKRDGNYITVVRYQHVPGSETDAAKAETIQLMETVKAATATAPAQAAPTPAPAANPFAGATGAPLPPAPAPAAPQAPANPFAAAPVPAPAAPPVPQAPPAPAPAANPFAAQAPPPAPAPTPQAPVPQPAPNGVAAPAGNPFAAFNK